MSTKKKQLNYYINGETPEEVLKRDQEQALTTKQQAIESPFSKKLFFRAKRYEMSGLAKGAVGTLVLVAALVGITFLVEKLFM